MGWNGWIEWSHACNALQCMNGLIDDVWMHGWMDGLDGWL